MFSLAAKDVPHAFDLANTEEGDADDANDCRNAPEDRDRADERRLDDGPEVEPILFPVLFQFTVEKRLVMKTVDLSPTFHVRLDGELFSRRNAA